MSKAGRVVSILILLGHLSFEGRPSSREARPLPDIDISGSKKGIVPMPEEVDAIYKFFDRYTKIVAPNGKPIHIVIEEGYTDKQAVHARRVLDQHLTDVPGSRFGSDKSAIANAVADRNAVLALFESTESMQSAAARPFFHSGVHTQDLRAYETILEGTPEYMDQKDPTRNASYEEILHFVQAHGIDQADPVLTAALNDAFANAREKYIYKLDDDETHEYFICGLEAYFDLWRHDPTGTGIREEEYVPISRKTLKEVDPAMYDIIEGFFGDRWLYTADVDSGFEGTFSLVHDENATYSNKSQYLVHVSLTGKNDSNLVGNGFDNTLTGNPGDNKLTPGSGNDTLDGGKGVDTAVFSGPSTDYTVTRQDDLVMVEDKVRKRDGSNSLRNIERLQFSGCAPQEIDPALIARFRPAMIGCFAPIDTTTPMLRKKSIQR